MSKLPTCLPHIEWNTEHGERCNAAFRYFTDATSSLPNMKSVDGGWILDYRAFMLYLQYLLRTYSQEIYVQV